MIRVPFYVPAVDPESPAYNMGDSSGKHGPERHIDFTTRANTWSSLDLPSWARAMRSEDETIGLTDRQWRSILHRPCFDVDAHVPADCKEVEALFRQAYWVKSTHNWHVYDDTLTSFELYMSKLRVLVSQNVVESGYYNASFARFATFLRQPHVRKLP